MSCHDPRPIMLLLYLYSCRLTGISPFFAKDQASTIACIQAAKLDNLLTALNEVSHDARDFIVNNVLKSNPR